MWTSSRGTFAQFPHRHIRVIMLETLESTPPSPTTGAGAQNPKVRPSPETDAARRRARQSMREYGLIWLLQQRLRAVSAFWASLALALDAATARPRHGSCQTLIILTQRPLSVSRALHVLSSCVLCSAPPAVDLLEALDRCVICTRRACCFCLRKTWCCTG